MFQLHPYQSQIVKDARTALSSGNQSVLIVSPAGSGKSIIIAEIARLTVKKGGHVMFMVHRKELVDQITESFKQQNVDLNRCTIMTVIKIKNRLDKLPRPNLIITDETHHSLAKTYRDIYDYYSDVPRLGFTATPYRMSGAGMGEVYDKMILGKSVKWLIDNNYLAPYKYYSVASVDSSKLKKSSNGDYSNKSMNEAMDNNIYGDTVKNYKKFADGKQAILYAHNVEFSKRYADEFNIHGISAQHCDAKTPAKERDSIMADFKAGKIKVLCNVDLIGEGFNVPDVPVVMLLRPTASLVVYIQQSMRGMRYRPGKTSIIIDQVKNYERHGLPDTPHEWTLEGRKKKDTEDIPKIHTCEHCFMTFYDWDTDECGHSICPYCSELAPQAETKKKKIVSAELEEISQAQAQKAYWAKKHPKQQRTLLGIYQVLKAQKDLGIGNNRYPEYRAMHMRLDQVKDISDDELRLLAKVMKRNFYSVKHVYENVKSTHKPKNKTKIFNF